METMNLEEALQQWRELLACMASLRLVPRSPEVIRTIAGVVRVTMRRAVVRLHAARCALGDAAAQLVIGLFQKRPIGIHPIGRFAFLATEWFSIAAAAERVGVSIPTIRRAIESSALPAFRFGKRLVRVRAADLDAWVTKQPLSVRNTYEQSCLRSIG
jgi:excisionase family DNA binding protein